MDRRLGGVVRRLHLRAVHDEPGHRPDVDDASLPPRDHVGTDLLGHPPQRGEVGVDDVRPLVVGDLEAGRWTQAPALLTRASISPAAAWALLTMSSTPARSVRSPSTTWAIRPSPLDLRADILRSLGVAAVDDDVCAGLREGTREGSPQSPGGTGDERGAAGQREGVEDRHGGSPIARGPSQGTAVRCPSAQTASRAKKRKHMNDSCSRSGGEQLGRGVRRRRRFADRGDPEPGGGRSRPWRAGVGARRSARRSGRPTRSPRSTRGCGRSGPRPGRRSRSPSGG